MLVLEEQDYGKLVEFVHVQQDEEIQTKQRKPNKPPAAPKEPPKPDMPKPSMDMSNAQSLDIGGLDVATDLSID